MKRLIIWSFLVIVFLQGCDLREREDMIQKREAALNEKEQQLLLKEKTLQLKEEELAKKQQAIDSTIVSDTTAKHNSALVGNWAVKMTCSETSCPGSAVGDTKTETWEISYQGMNVIAKAKVNDELVRVYSGIYNGSSLELLETLETAQQPTTKIVARVQLVNDNVMEGQRHIDRLDEKCKIVYALLMEKK